MGFLILAKYEVLVGPGKGGGVSFGLFVSATPHVDLELRLVMGMGGERQLPHDGQFLCHLLYLSHLGSACGALFLWFCSPSIEKRYANYANSDDPDSNPFKLEWDL